MEIWKPIDGYENLYEVSNHGRVRSLDHYASNGQKLILYKGKVLSPNMGTNGYYSVQLSKNNKIVRKMIHRLVALTFIKNPNPDKYNMVNHKDEVRTNNNANNLEWCNAKYNTNYGTGMKRLSELKKGKDNLLLRKSVQCVETGIIYSSLKEAAQKTNANKAAISMVINGKRNKAGGYGWIKI